MKKNTSMIDYLNEYSDVNQDKSSQSSVRATRQLAFDRQSSISLSSFNEGASSQDKKKIQPALRRKSTIGTLLTQYGQFEDKLIESSQFSWNIFTFNSSVGRDNTLPLLSVHFMLQHHLDVYINDRKFALFIGEVMKAYRRDVAYHNDLHGVDVAHMAHTFLTKGKLISLAELEHIDIMSLIIGAMCHDLGHDGYNNGYHVNALTERAIRYSD